MGRNRLDLFAEPCGSMYVESDRTEADLEEGNFRRERYSYPGNYSLLNSRRRFGIRPIFDAPYAGTPRFYARHFVYGTRNDPPVARRIINSTRRCCRELGSSD